MKTAQTVTFDQHAIRRMSQTNQDIQQQLGIDVYVGVEDSLIAFSRAQDGTMQTVSWADHTELGIAFDTESFAEVSAIIREALERSAHQIEALQRRGHNFAQIIGHNREDPIQARSIQNGKDRWKQFAGTAAASNYFHPDDDSGILEYRLVPASSEAMANSTNLIRNNVREALAQHGYLCAFASEYVQDIIPLYDAEINLDDFQPVRLSLMHNHAHASISVQRDGQKLFNQGFSVDGRTHTYPFLEAFSDHLVQDELFGDENGRVVMQEGNDVQALATVPDNRDPVVAGRDSAIREYGIAGDMVCHITTAELAGDGEMSLPDLMETIAGSLEVAVEQTSHLPGKPTGSIRLP